MSRRGTLLLGMLLGFGGAASAATPPSPEVDAKSEAACAAGSLLKGARVGAPVHFSNRTGFDVRIVTGTYPQPSKKGAHGTMLCIYHRKSGGAEVVPAEGLLPAGAAVASQPAAAAGAPPMVVEYLTGPESAPSSSTADEPAAAPVLTGVAWRAVRIDGRAVAGGAKITLRFGDDGKVTGVSGCNDYTAGYERSDRRLRIRPPFTHSQTTCAPEVMEEETRFLEILFTTQAVKADGDARMVLSTSAGRTVVFVRDGP